MATYIDDRYKYIENGLENKLLKTYINSFSCRCLITSSNNFASILCFFSLSLEPNTLIKSIPGTHPRFSLVTSPSNGVSLECAFSYKEDV